MEVVFDFNSVARQPQISSPFLHEIRELFSAEDKALAFIARRTGRRMPTRKYAITPKGGFDLPFFEEICSVVKLKYPAIQIKTTKAFDEYAKLEPIATAPVELDLTPRDYQGEAISKALANGKGVIVLPTSAGKTLVIALIAFTAVMKQKSRVLVLVPDIGLVNQSYKDFIDYGIPEELVSKWTGSNEYTPTKIVVANSQILLSKKQDTSVLNSFGVLIVDECHKMFSAEKISRLVKGLKINHKFGFTGSLPEAQFDVWSINRIFGPVIYRKKSVELRDINHISQVRVVMLEMQYKTIPEFATPSMAAPTVGYEEETTWLQTAPYRNEMLAKLINKLETNTLVLVDRIAHGEYLLEYIQSRTDKKVYFVQGSVEVEERERIKQLMEETDGVVCIAIAKIFSTGISIKNLHNVVFAAIGKARIKIIQAIGRSLRLHASKTMATIFDVADICLTYGAKHAEERVRIYKAEQIPVIRQQLVEK